MVVWILKELRENEYDQITLYETLKELIDNLLKASCL